MGINRREVLKRAGVGAAVAIGVPAMAPGEACAVTSAESSASSEVSFVGASSSGTRRKAILDVLTPWRSKVAAEIAGKTIIIKANLVGLAWGSGSAQVLPITHVDALRGVLDFLRSISDSVPIIIGDCSVNADLTGTWTKAGYPALTKEYTGVTLMDLGDPQQFPAATQTIWKPDLSATTTIPISTAFTDPKFYVISICRPKTHDTVVMTATCKNILMGAPLRAATVDDVQVNPKNLMHGRGTGSTGKKQDEAKCLSYNLFQLANVIYPKGVPALCVLDAWEGMQGDGPVFGRSIMQYCAVAGTDSLAVDRLSATLMGFADTIPAPGGTPKPSYVDMRYLVWLSDAGFGNYDLSKVDFISGSLDQVRDHIKAYAMHSGYAKEVDWGGGPPPVIGGPPPITGGTTGPDPWYLDPRPFLLPQANAAASAGNVGVSFSLPVETSVRLGIFTLQGAEVRRLAHHTLPAGRYSVSWDRRDGLGSRVPAGNYLVRLGFGSGSPDEGERTIEDRVRLAG